MKIPNEMLFGKVCHRYAGNDWIVVDAHEGEWMDIVHAGKGELGNQFFRVWSKCLSLDNLPIHHTLMDKIKDIRDKIASGEWRVVDTRLVKA